VHAVVFLAWNEVDRGEIEPSTYADGAGGRGCDGADRRRLWRRGGDDSGSASGDDSGVTLTMYTDQHAELVEGLTAAYTAETGVRFDIQNGATVGQIEAEGAASRADVFLSEDPGPAAQLGAARTCSNRSTSRPSTRCGPA
jgi:hypothetical protein